MLVRLVRMTLHPDAVGTFLALFDETAPRIRSFRGCRHLELWKNDRYPNILTTYSHWTDASALERYRASDVFREAWGRTKPLFAAPPEAHSYLVMRSGDFINDLT